LAVRLDERTAIDEARSIASIEIGLRRQSFRQDNVVLIKFDVPIFDRRSLLLNDRLTVLQNFDRHQHARTSSR
jgi:hypothetical protein